ncbi:MAG: BrnA antitoxin family protein [Alphaproteobacteria bacterium]
MSERDDNPAWTDAAFAEARPFREVFPEQFRSVKRGRPKIVSPKVHIGFRLAADVVADIRASGRGYNARVEKVLREALAKGDL